MSNEQQFEKFVRNNYGVGKTHRSVDEAFKTADYATPMWRCETQHQYEVRKVIDLLIFGVTIGFFVAFCWAVSIYIQT